jgi:hypothetical protein
LFAVAVEARPVVVAAAAVVEVIFEAAVAVE